MQVGIQASNAVRAELPACNLGSPRSWKEPFSSPIIASATAAVGTITVVVLGIFVVVVVILFASMKNVVRLIMIVTGCNALEICSICVLN